MTVHAMIDLETFGTNPDCVITSMGAIKFSPFNDEEPHDPLYIKAEVEQQTEMGRTIDDSTMAWWAKQDSKVRDEAFSEDGRINLEEMTTQLNKFLVGVDKIWCQGPAFDMVILEDLYRQLQRPTPWQFWQVRDSRTLFGLMPSDPRKEIQEDLHNALADCYYQAICVQKTFKHFGIVK
mgnify:CR=1 FL=1